MKKILFSIILALSITTSAQAYWECGASSIDGWGIGKSNYLDRAKYDALRMCSMNTSPQNICYIDYCIIKGR